MKTWFAAATAPTNPGDGVPAMGVVEAMGARDSIVGPEGVAEVTASGGGKAGRTSPTPPSATHVSDSLRKQAGGPRDSPRVQYVKYTGDHVTQRQH